MSSKYNGVGGDTPGGGSIRYAIIASIIVACLILGAIAYTNYVQQTAPAPTPTPPSPPQSHDYCTVDLNSLTYSWSSSGSHIFVTIRGSDVSSCGIDLRMTNGNSMWNYNDTKMTSNVYVFVNSYCGNIIPYTISFSDNGSTITFTNRSCV